MTEERRIDQERELAEAGLAGSDLMEVPRTRSRAGDFAYSAAAAMVTFFAMMAFGNVPAETGAIGLTMFLLAIGLRYYTLRDAKAVQAGVNVTEDQMETLQRLREVLNALPQPVMLLGSDSHVEMANPASETMFGGNVIGRHISGLLRNPAALNVMARARQSNQPDEAELTLPGPVPRCLLCYAAPIGPDVQGDDARLFIMLRDRTEQKKLERMRTDFVANASHELRTPLTSMAGFIETLQGHAKDDPEAQARFLKIMSGQADRMLRLVEDLIGLSAIELNESKLPEEDVPLCSLAKSVVESLGPQVDVEHATLILNPSDPSREYFVRGDRHDLFRLIQNLSENGLKYGASDQSPAEVEIAIGEGSPPRMPGADRTGATTAQIAARAGVPESALVWLQVRDNGRGIDPTDLPRLTERFYRVSPEISRAKGGTGLGLAIVKHILQRHQAGLIVESAIGIGATFTCLFPPPSGEEEPRTPPSTHQMREDR
ncbi:MAG: ATP-binding protein [Parvularcula sp.]